MAITRSTGALIGTTEGGTTITLANNATAYTSNGTASTDVDLLGANNSVGDIWLYLNALYASGVNVGSIDITFSSHRVAGQAYLKTQPDFQIPPANSTNLLIPLGKRPVNRYFAVQVLNNATGATITGLNILYELEVLV